MPTHVAFLKGMNLGNRRLTNEELRGHFETIGLTDVATFRASGNVVFSCPKGRREGALVELVEGELAGLLGYPVATFVRSGEELRAIAAAEPFDAPTRDRLHGKPQVMLLGAKPAAPARRQALALAGKEDALVFGPRELHWLPAGGVSESSLDTGALARALGDMTVRTMGTIEQIAARWFERPAAERPLEQGASTAAPTRSRFDTYIASSARSTSRSASASASPANETPMLAVSSTLPADSS